jgi:predicted GIY-YIG superfamily endonuclease
VEYCVYILYSQRDSHLYVGCTSNLARRIKRHQNGEVQATKLRRPLILIHTEVGLEKSVAFQRERFLKSLLGVREKKKILQRYLDGVRG